MKILLEIFDRTRGYFSDKGPLRPFQPIFNATEGFFFSPAEESEHAPFVRDPLDIKRFMSMVILALVPALLMSLYYYGLRVLAMIMVSYVVGGTIEVLFAIIRKDEINEGFLVTGLLFPLILPPALPLWMVGVGVAFGVVVGKEIFGGTGRNLFNPALVGRIFLALAYPAAMSGNWITPLETFPGRLLQYVPLMAPDAITSATPLVLAKQGTVVPIDKMFTGAISGSAGETSAVAIILGGLFLLLTRVASWRIVFSMLASFLALETLLFYTLPTPIPPPYWQLMAGGLLFGAFFMTTDPVTSPATNGAKIAYGIIIGIATGLIRHLSGFVEGVMFAILLGNIIAPLLDEINIYLRLRRLGSEK